MNEPLMRLSKLVADKTGLRFPATRLSDLRRGMERAARDFGFDDLQSCIDWLLVTSLNREQVAILASNLTVGETYFLREKRTFEVLEEHILPELVARRCDAERGLRVWSAGCCSGEEPYSIAIALIRTVPALSSWNATILGTDINPIFLRKASEGKFSKWSFRNTPAGFQDRYFTPAPGDCWQIRNDVRAMVDLSNLNLAEDSYPSLLNNTNAMDVIFCRNVLIYFSPEMANVVIQRLAKCLSPGGYLILGASECTNFPAAGLETKFINGLTFYQKPIRENRASAKQAIPGVALGDSTVSEVCADANVMAIMDSECMEPAEPPQHDAVGGVPPVVFGNLVRHYLSGEYDVVIEYLTKYLIDNRSEYPASMLLTRALANSGRLSEALLWCDRMVAIDKFHAAAHYLRATILLEQGDHDSAAAALTRSLYIDPEFVVSHFALGNLARQRGRLAVASAHFQNALVLAREYSPDDLIPEADGLNAARLTAIISTILEQKSAA